MPQGKVSAAVSHIVRWCCPNCLLCPPSCAGPDATHALFNAIQNVILRALLAVQPAMINDKHSFEVRCLQMQARQTPRDRAAWVCV